MKFLTNPIVRGQLRHLASAVGSVVAAHGYMSSSNIELYLGLAFALLAIYDSYKTKQV